MSEEFAALMREFGQMAGLEGLVPDEHGECVLAIDDFVVALSCLEGETLLVYAAFGKLGGEGREALMARLLEGNYFYSGTGGATLGLSPLDGELQLLYRERLKGLGAMDLTRILENFLERLTYWSKAFTEGAKSPPPSTAPATMPFGGIRG